MATADGVDETADRLYALPPVEFIAARDEEALAARTAGDRARATAITKFRRPTVAAWMVNLLALRRPDSIRDLLELGVDLRRAQIELQGSQLRDLTARRRAAVGALVNEAARLATDAGASLSTLPLVEVETTLTAAVADAALADTVRAGRLLKSGTYDGFGELPRPSLHVVPPATTAGVPDVPVSDPTSEAVDDNGKRPSGAGDDRSVRRPSGARDERTDRTAGRPFEAADDAADLGVRRHSGTPDVQRPDARGQAVDQRTSRERQDAAEAVVARERLDAAARALADAEAAHAAALAAIEARSREVAEVEERLAALRSERRTVHEAVLAAQAAGDAAASALEGAQRRHAAAVRAAERKT